MTNEKIHGEIVRPFSPAIGKYKIPTDTIHKLNIHIDNIIKDQNKIEELYNGNNLAGEIKYEVKISKDFLEESLSNLLKNYVFNYIKLALNKEFKSFEIKSCWAVCQFESDYNPVHWHDGHVSGVMYTKIPKNFGESYKKINKNGIISFIHGTSQLTSTSLFDIKPEVGDLFIFPSYMMHTVYPFFSDQERRSISFNAFIDKEIASY